MDLYLATSHFLMTMECLGREIDHIKAIAVAIGIDTVITFLLVFGLSEIDSKYDHIDTLHQNRKSDHISCRDHGKYRMGK